MTPRVFEGPDLLLWDRARRFGIRSKQWHDTLLHWRLLWWPVKAPNKSEQIAAIIGVLSDIGNPDLRRQCLQEFVRYIFAAKRPGKKKAHQSEEYLRLALKIYSTIEKIREGDLSKNEAMQAILNERQKFGFGPTDSLPATIEGIEEYDRVARQFFGFARTPIPRRPKKSRPGSR